MRLKAQAFGKILRKYTNERAKLENFTEFHGKLPISRKTVHFTVRVTAVKSRNRLGPKYELIDSQSLCNIVRRYTIRCDILIRSGDICDRSLKSSEIAPNFARFYHH